MRCAKQRWRAARGKQISIALMMPAAPSEVTRSGSLRPRLFMSSKNAVTVSVSSLEPAIICSSTRRPSIVKPQAAKNRLAFGARPQTLGNAVDKQIDDLVFAQVALGKRLVILPQPLPKLRHRCLR